MARESQLEGAGSQGSSLEVPSLKMFDLKHSNHIDASKDPVSVEAQSCHQPQVLRGPCRSPWTRLATEKSEIALSCHLQRATAAL